MSVRVKPITEAEFLAQVLQLAALFGYRTFHQRPGLTRSGRWCSAVQGSGVGFPDVVIVKHKLIVAELKVGNNQLSPQQTAWLNSFRAAGVEAHCWYPKHWGEIERTLRG